MAEAKFRDPEPLDWLRTGVVIAAACTAVVGMGAWLGGIYPALVIAGAAAVLILLVRWHAANTGYRCADCGHEFAISAWADFLSPHMLTTKYVKCPHCGRRSWMAALVRE